MQEAFLKSGDRLQGGETVLLVEVTANPTLPDTVAESDTLPTRPAIVVVECLNCGRRDQAEASAPDEHLTFLCEDCRIELRNQPQPAPGYDLIRVLGRGGMGCVMLCRDQKSGRAVAIKTLLPEIAVSDKAMNRFLREVDVAAALKHPHIVEFLDRGSDNGVVYLVTEFIDGVDSARLADSRGGRLPYQQAIRIVTQTLDALSYAHAQGYIHSRHQGSNIMVAGQWPITAKLTDFGLAKSFSQSGMSGMTMAWRDRRDACLHAARTDQEFPRRGSDPTFTASA